MTRTPLLPLLCLTSLVACIEIDETDQLDTASQGMVVGNDDRIAVTANGSNVPERYRPYLDAIGRLTGAGGTCTATHLGDGLVITAGHCMQGIAQAETNLECPPNTQVEWGRRAGTTFMTSTCTRVLAVRNQAPYDYALFEVTPIPPVAIPHRANAGSSGNPAGTTGTLFSHPGGGDLQWSQTCSIPSSGEGFAHACDTMGGSSGAAMIDDATLQIVGIHHSTNNVNANFGVYLGGTPLGSVVPAHRVDGDLRSASSGLCADVAGYSSDDRAPFQMWGCNNAANQRLRRIGPYFLIGHSGKCLDSPYATPGTQPWQFWCWGGWNQQWQRQDHDVRHVSGKCLDVPYGHSGSNVWLFDCWNGPNQKFTITEAGEIKTPDGRCLDLPWTSANGTQVIAVTCHGGANQKWTFNDNGEIRGLDGKCLDLANNNTTNRTLFQVWDCNGSNAQKFFTSGEVRGPGNLCLEAPWGAGWGTRPQLASCTGAANQRWDHRW